MANFKTTIEFFLFFREKKKYYEKNAILRHFCPNGVSSFLHGNCLKTTEDAKSGKVVPYT